MARSLDELRKHRRSIGQLSVGQLSVVSGPLSVVSCPLSVVSSPLSVVSSTNEASPIRSTADEVAAAHENAPNEPTAAGPNAPNQPTAALEIVPNEPTAAGANAPNEPTVAPEDAPNEPTAASTNCQLSLVSGPLSVVGCTNDASPIRSTADEVVAAHENAPNEPTAGGADAPNEPTAVGADAPNEPTAGGANAPNEPTDAPKTATNEPTDAPISVTIEPTAPRTTDDGPRTINAELSGESESEWLRKGVKSVAARRAETLRKLNEQSRKGAELARTTRRSRRVGDMNGKTEGHPNNQKHRSAGKAKTKQQAALAGAELDTS